MNSFTHRASPYYVFAPAHLDDGDEATWQLHVLCSLLNRAGYPAYLVDAPKTDGRLWTPVLTASQMAAHHLSGLRPISVAGFRAPEVSPRPGLQVVFRSEWNTPDGQLGKPGVLCFDMPGPVPGATIHKEWPIALPWVDPEAFVAPPPDAPRSGALVHTGRLPALNQKPLAEHAGLQDLSQHVDVPLGPDARFLAIKTASTLYAYAKSAITTEARLCGCQVVYVPNDYLLPSRPSLPLETVGCAYGLQQAPMHPDCTLQLQGFTKAYAAHIAHCEESVRGFVALTQRAAAQMDNDLVWLSTHTEQLENWLPALTEDKAKRADAQAYQKLATSYKDWSKRATLREVHADIYAEFIAHQRVQPACVHVFAQDRSMDALAATLDDVAASWLPNAAIVIHAPYPSPVPAEELGTNVNWLTGDADSLDTATHPLCVLVDAGTRLEPHATLELLLALETHADAQLAFAAEDVPGLKGARVPFFKGMGHVEWLRQTNCLGGIVAVRTAAWRHMPDRHDYVSVYRLALSAVATHGAVAARYVDKILSHASPDMPAGREVRELAAATGVLQTLLPHTVVQATDTVGCWQVRYPDDPQARVSLVIPTGKQLGYLKSLLLSVRTYAADEVDDIVLLVQPTDAMATRNLLETMLPAGYSDCIRLIETQDGPYHHALSLNQGLAAARHELVLVCDDDVEFIEAGCVRQLRRLMSQADVAVVAPRLVLQVNHKPTLMGGPCISGEGAQLLSYVGEQQWLTENGQFNRLQMAQDVAGVLGSCAMVRKSAVVAVGGWDETHARVFSTMADLGYRLTDAGWRLVWTPAASMLHAGGATRQSVRRHQQIDAALTQQHLNERDALGQRWLGRAPGRDLYSRHLSGHSPYRLDAELVVDWEPARHDRPRAIAQPISSGSGQYRVVEPLDWLQHESKAETCLVNPVGKQARRLLTPLDIARAKPDRVLLQHSIGDADIASMRAIRAQCPGTFIIQLMDDLSSDLPRSHPAYVQGQRESHGRTLEALSLSDRLLVSTQPLADYYRAFCADVRVVPNALDARAWGSFFRPAPDRQRLRVGWAGAAQHQGDLKLIQTVVAELANEVDLVFMGMCPNELRPFIKEFHTFVSYKDYPAKLASLDLDIALAPLENNPFNACKSNLRLLEYGAMGWPVVCSDVYPFRTSSPPVAHVSDDPEQWLNAIRALMNSHTLRAQQGKALNDWLTSHYWLEHQADAWYSAIFD